MDDDQSEFHEAAAAAAFLNEVANGQRHLVELNTPNPYATNAKRLRDDQHIPYDNNDAVTQSYHDVNEGLTMGSFSFSTDESSLTTSGWVNGVSSQQPTMGGFGENGQMNGNECLSEMTK